jgi:type IX secretion system substrate protein/Big-like domain-containing protein
VTNSCGTAVATSTTTVNPLPASGAITGAGSVCAGATLPLSDGVAGGIWSSNATSIATVSSTGIVNGIASGSATISYLVTNSCGSAVATRSVIVLAAPVAGVISGAGTVCAGATLSLTDAVSGGVWSTGSTAIASVSSTGVVTGIAGGIAMISYAVTNSCGTAVATSTVMVNPLPVSGAITGAGSVCAGATIPLSDGVAGGIWSSSATSIATVGSSGVVNGIASGSATISYLVTNSCGSAVATRSVVVLALPVAGVISGPGTVCAGATIALSDMAGGGVWSSGSTGIATVGSGGVVTGVSAGTAIISYSVTNSCGTDVALKPVTVNPLTLAGTITGITTICALSSTPLSDAVPGGIWSSGATSVATISATGIVTGVSAGTAMVSYTVTNSCGIAVATLPVTVNPLPDAGVIAGLPEVCEGATITLSDGAGGGVWSASNTTAAVSGGIVNGLAAGIDTIIYTVSNSCGSATTAQSITIDPLPVAGVVTGVDSVCAGETIFLSDLAPGGTWSSDNTSLATITGSGILTGISSGAVNITYTVANTCGTDAAMFPVYVQFPGSCTAGVNTVPVFSSLNVYPNPNSGSFAVEMLCGINEELHIAITNLIGEKVKEFTAVTNTVFNVSLDGVAGIYILSATTQHDSYDVRLIITR